MVVVDIGSVLGTTGDDRDWEGSVFGMAAADVGSKFGTTENNWGSEACNPATLVSF